MKQQKRHRTNFISGVIALVTLGLLVLLAVALYKHTELEVRFDALISWLRRLDESIVGLDRRRLGRYDPEYSSNALYSGLDSI